MADKVKEVLISEKDLTDTNYKSLKEHSVIKIKLKDSYGNIHMPVDVSIEANNITTGWNIILSKKLM